MKLLLEWPQKAGIDIGRLHISWYDYWTNTWHLNFATSHRQLNIYPNFFYEVRQITYQNMFEMALEDASTELNGKI